MKTLSTVGAILTLSAAATIPLHDARASTISITGAAYPGFVGDGTSITKNNVVGFGPSGLSDPTKGAAWKEGGSVLSNVDYFNVDWYFNGAESGNDNKFASMALSFTEHNQNNNYNKGNDPGWEFLGTTTGSGKNSPIPFSVTDLNYGTGVENGANNPPGLLSSLILSYVTPKFNRHGKIEGWKLTLTPTDWLVFAFDDPGSADNDYDDYVGVGHVRLAEAPPPSPTPLPGTLPLMGTVLGGGLLFRRWRSYRTQRAVAQSSA